MFRFASPEYLYALALPLIIIIVYVLSNMWHKRRMNIFGNPVKLWSLVDNRSVIRIHVKFVLEVTALILLILVLARPQWGLHKEIVKRTGIEAVISLDVSNSMLAEDVRPNRLERSKMLLSALVEKMKDDKIALNVFAGEAYPQLPITNDVVSVKMFLDAVSTGMVTLQGTNLASAIDLARNSFTKDEKVGKAIIVITDGEDHEEGALEAAKVAKEEGLKLFVLGVGSTGGANIPTSNGFLTDKDGRYVRTAVNEKMCQDVAEAGGGLYIHVDNTNTAQQLLLTEIEKMQKSESESASMVYNEQFVAIALLIFVILFIEFMLLDTVNPLYRKTKLFSK